MGTSGKRTKQNPNALKYPDCDRIDAGDAVCRLSLNGEEHKRCTMSKRGNHRRHTPFPPILKYATHPPHTHPPAARATCTTGRGRCSTRAATSTSGSGARRCGRAKDRSLLSGHQRGGGGRRAGLDVVTLPPPPIAKQCPGRGTLHYQSGDRYDGPSLVLYPVAIP